MADHTQTVTNAMVIMGTSQGNLWGTFLWNENWGTSEDLWTSIEKAIGNGISLADVLAGKDFVKAPLNNTITITEELVSVLKELGIWDYVFTRPTTQGIDKLTDQFSKSGNQSSTWSDVADGDTTWSDV